MISSTLRFAFVSLSIVAVIGTTPLNAFAQCGAMQNLGTMPGGLDTYARGASSDGSVVVGMSFIGNINGYRAFRWTTAGGMQNLGTLPGGTNSIAYGTSANGSVVVGYSSTETSSGRPDKAFRWTATGGMQDLGTLPGGLVSQAYSTSADGSVVVGYSYNGSVFRAFRWTVAQGMQDLGTLPGENSSFAYGVSADGSVVVGQSGRAFRWTATGGMQSLGTLPGGVASAANKTSADGSVVVGWSTTGNLASRAFRWTMTGGMQDLGALAGGSDSDAQGVSDDGLVVVGRSSTSNGYRAIRWTAAQGMQDLGTLPGTSSSNAYGVSANGNVVVGYTMPSPGIRAFRWGGASELLFRESDNASWTFGPDGIPGWDHVGLFVRGRVYESHPGYGNRSFWDPVASSFVPLTQDFGIQWQHTRGSFQHDSTTNASTAGNLAIGVDSATACRMADFIETQASSPFLYICPSVLDLTCMQQQLAPQRQKGRLDGTYTCVGLIERAAEEAGLNGGQGFVPNDRESFSVPLFGEVPCLSPMVLSWFAQNGFNFASSGAVFGLFDPVDFMLTDPLGRRLGHTAMLGTLNEIPGAFFTGNGTIEQFMIVSPIPGAYQLQLVGIGGNVGAAVGGLVQGMMFEGPLAAGATRDMPFVVPPPCRADFNRDSVVDFFDYLDFVEAFAAGC